MQNILDTEVYSELDNLNISLEDVVSLDFLQLFQENFAISTGVGALFFDKNMKPITKPSNFGKLCEKFFRKYPNSCKLCQESDNELIKNISKTNKPYISYCKNGLIDFGAPVILNGSVIGVLIAGQVLTTEPNKAKFIEHAKWMGADVNEFVEALEKVPVISEEKVNAMLNLLKLIAEKLSELGYQHLILEKNNSMLNEEIEKRIFAEQKLKKLNSELEILVKERTLQLKNSNIALEQSLENLKKSQEYLIQSQKMAALGSLVIGISHQLNTPLGVAITTSSYLNYLFEEILKIYKELDIKNEKLIKTHGNILNSCEILSDNLNKSVTLVNNFKQIALDQTEKKSRIFNLKEYTESIFISMSSELKIFDVEFNVDYDSIVEINAYPGILTQIITNLLQNSLTHAFNIDNNNKINLKYKVVEDTLFLTYEDNGIGMSEKDVQRAFDPFYTTRLYDGKSGLGLFVVYNLVVSKLRGDIKLESEINKGVTFKISMPLSEA